jgi:hypothetical protein
VKLQPDHKLVFKADWEDGVEQLRGTRSLIRELAHLAERKEPPLPPTASGEAMPRLNIGKPKSPPPPPAKLPPKAPQKAFPGRAGLKPFPRGKSRFH